MSRESKIRKKTVELEGAPRPSRIRRDPVPDQPRGLAGVDWGSREWEIRLALAGMVLFALALWAVTIGISEITSH